MIINPDGTQCHYDPAGETEEKLINAEQELKVMHIELDMLRTFYENWITMHAIKYDDLHKRQKQEAAQILWDQAQRLKNFYLPTTEMRLVQPVPAR